MIQDQVKLPLRVAVGVVLRGIRIRLGRSLVTLTGVVLGIAFLMSTLAGQLIKESVREEDALRAEVKRMSSFLEAEMGPPEGRTLGVIQTGPINEAERRLIQHLIEGGLLRLQWAVVSPAENVSVFSGVEQDTVALESVAKDANGVLLMGPGNLPEAFSGAAGLNSLFEGAKERVLAMTRAQTQALTATGVSVVTLAREWTPEEMAKVEAEKRTAVFRSRWIVLISLVVTTAGIANAMLMSVTERFREIGTMKCLGALSSFVRWMFFIESGILGAAGGAAGAALGAIAAIAVYGFIYGFGAVLASMSLFWMVCYLLLSTLAGVALSIAAAIYPASVAASMIPAHALRTNV